MTISSVNSSLDFLHPCSNSTASISVSAAYYATLFLLLLPLSIFILYLGYQRWQQQHSFKSASHSDVFTYHNAVLQLIGALGVPLYSFGYNFNLPAMAKLGYFCSSIMYFGENFFHILTCVERYLAVVHPVIYLGLRNTRGVRIRTISIAGAWMLCFIWTSVLTLCPTFPTVAFYMQLGISLVITTTCSLCVLCVLIRPGPGERGGEHVDQSKQRAFYTIMAIMGALWLWCLGYTVTETLADSPMFSHNCVMKSSAFWFHLPSSMVLPLLYLHRAGKLPCFHGNSRSR